MNEELKSWTDDLIYKHALTFSHEELAGMYSLCNKREQDYLKEIKALRLILQSHGEVIEMNAELKLELVGVTDRLRIKEEENARLREALGEAARLLRRSLNAVSPSDIVSCEVRIKDFLAKRSKERGE